MPLSSATTDRAPEPTPAQLERFRALIEERVGIYYPDSRRDSLRRALATTMARSEVADCEEYARLLAGREHGDDEFLRLLPHLLIHETDFFRTPAHFEALRRVLVPTVLRQRLRGPLSIWSAGCATGEEPFSIAITLAEMGAPMHQGVETYLLATDIGADVVARARRGWYHERALRRVPPEQVSRYFRKSDAGYEISPNLQPGIVFHEFNLAHPRYPVPPAGAWDIIFCRNVLMYFRAQTTQQVLARFHQVLRPGGFLFLSPTEHLTCAEGDFETIEVAGAFVYVKPPLDELCASLHRASRSRVETGSRKREVARPSAATAAAIRRGPAAAGMPAPRVSEHEACERALADIAADRWQQAEQALAEFLDLREQGARGVFLPTSSAAERAHLLLAWVRAMRGNTDEAAALCLEFLARDPLLGPAHYILGLIACRAGDPDQGAEHLGRAIYSDCRLVPAYYHLGVVQCSQGDLPAARRAFLGGLHALDQEAGSRKQGAGGAWLDFAEGLTPDHWRRACEERLASLGKGE